MLFAALVYNAAANAQEGDQELARQAFQRGVEALQARRYATAIVEFELSLGLMPRCSTQFNLGVAFEQVGRHGDSLDLFERYERECAASMNAQNASYLSAALPRLRARVGKLVLRVTPANAVVSVSIDRRPRPTWLGEIPLDPGAHTVEVRTRDGRPMQRDVTIAAGSREVVEFTIGPHSSVPSTSLPLTPDPYRDEVRPVASTHVGRTRIESSVDGAIVWIDGQEVGLAPTDSQLSSGRHTIEVRADGHQRAQWSMTVTDGAVTRLAAQLEPVREGSTTERSSPFYTRWWFWTIVGVAALGGAVALTWELTRPTDSVVYTFEALSVP